MKTVRFFLSVALAAVALSCNTTRWQPVGDHIMTEWGENLDPNNVHQEYPRPQLVREDWRNLNGFWNYAITPIDAEDSDCREDRKSVV